MLPYITNYLTVLEVLTEITKWTSPAQRGKYKAKVTFQYENLVQAEVFFSFLKD